MTDARAADLTVTIVLQPPESRFDRWASAARVRVDGGPWTRVGWGEADLPVSEGDHVIEIDRASSWRAKGRSTRVGKVRVQIRRTHSTVVEVGPHGLQIVERPPT